MSVEAGSIDPDEARRMASALHLEPGLTVQELNWDEDAEPRCARESRRSSAANWWMRTSTTSSTSW